MKKAIAMLLTAVLLFGCVPGWAEESAGEKDPAALLPTLFISAEYGEPTTDGAISGEFTLECRYPEDPEGDASGAPGTELRIEGKNGLTLVEISPENSEIGDLSCGEIYSFSLKLQYDESLAEMDDDGKIRPMLTISAESPAIGGCIYNCKFDITPEPRALLMGVNTSPYLLDAYLMQETIGALSAEFERFYYDKQPISVSTSIMDVSDPGCAGFWESMETLGVFGADENDVTYLYIDAFTAEANGAPLSGIRAIEGGAEVNVTYDEIFAWLGENMKGRVIVLTDGRFAGMAVRSFAASGLDPELFNVIGVNTPTAPAGISEQGTPYQGMLARSIADAAEEVYTAAGFASFLNRADIATNEYLLSVTGAGMSSYSAGGADNLIFATDPGYDSGVRILAVEEESCVLTFVDVLHIYYQYLREKALFDNHMMSTPACAFVTSGNYWSDLALDGAEGYSSAVVCDLDKNGTQDMLAVHWSYDYASDTSHALNGYTNAAPEHLCLKLFLYQIVNGEVVMVDHIDHATYLDNYTPDSFGAGSVTLVEADGMITIQSVFSFSSSYSYNGGNGITCHVEDGKFVLGGGRNKVEHSEEVSKVHGQYYNKNWTSLYTALPTDPSFVEFYQTNYPEYISFFMYGNGGSGHNSVAFKNWDLTNLSEILNGTKKAKYYEPVVLPDYVAPPISTGSEQYCGLIRSIMQDVFPGAELTEEYTSDSHQQFRIRIPETVTVDVSCTEEGIPTKIDVRSRSGVDEWKDEFQAIYDAVLRLPETGLSEEEYAQLSGYRLKKYESFQSANDRVHGQFLPQPMYEDYAILMIYLDAE